MKQTINPFLPNRVYIADGEPHVFGDRVYLFGSHDKENADTYCALDYEFYSAPINDLSNWTSKGINYKAIQDPLSTKTNRKYMYAPDVVRGNDGRYYLYYCLSGEKGHGGYYGPISVAVCDSPDGKYEFLGYVKNEDGSLHNKNVCFDPAVINDDGTIRLYYGTLYPYYGRKYKNEYTKAQVEMFNKKIEDIESKDGVMGPFHVVLADDMLTVKSKAVRVLPVNKRKAPFDSHLTKKPIGGHRMFGSAFYEGSSIRKIDNRYYFIYSSMNNHELCYAVSKYPDYGFKYGGVIISNGDVGYMGRKEADRLNYTATNHGSIENILGKYYVFYHRQTHGSDYSREAMVEPITILEDGSIPQVEMTSMGFSGKALKGIGKYFGGIACNITNGKMPHGSNKRIKDIPCISSDESGKFVLTYKNTLVNYKYFDLSKTSKIVLEVRGIGKLLIMANDKICDTIKIKAKDITSYSARILGEESSVLSFKTIDGKIDIYSFELM